ncbi:hypothetical protein ABN584_14915 [Gloeocapsa sp. BRSZ]
MTKTKQYGFRLNLEQQQQFERLVAASGLSTQEFCVSRLLATDAEPSKELASVLKEMAESIKELTEANKEMAESIKELKQPEQQPKQPSTKHQIRGVEARAILNKGYRDKDFIYWQRNLYLVEKTANGNQYVLEKELDIPDEIADYLDKEISGYMRTSPIPLRRLYEVVEAYGQLVVLDGSELLTDRFGFDGVITELFNEFRFGRVGSIKSFLSKAKRMIVEAKRVLEEAPTEPLATPTEPIKLLRDDFAKLYSIDVATPGYSQVLKAAKSGVGWLAEDGRSWFVEGTGKKAIWSAKVAC